VHPVDAALLIEYRCKTTKLYITVSFSYYAYPEGTDSDRENKDDLPKLSVASYGDESAVSLWRDRSQVHLKPKNPTGPLLHRLPIVRSIWLSRTEEIRIELHKTLVLDEYFWDIRVRKITGTTPYRSYLAGIPGRVMYPVVVYLRGLAGVYQQFMDGLVFSMAFYGFQHCAGYRTVGRIILLEILKRMIAQLFTLYRRQSWTPPDRVWEVATSLFARWGFLAFFAPSMININELAASTPKTIYWIAIAFAIRLSTNSLSVILGCFVPGARVGRLSRLCLVVLLVWYTGWSTCV
jgi:hypothetical protein